MRSRSISFKLIVILLFTARTEEFNITRLIEKLPEKTMPKTNDGEPIQVLVGFYAQSLGNIEATRMAFDIDIYLRLSWQDPRLSHEQQSVITINDLDILRHLWDVTVPNFVLYVENDGTCSYSTRVTAHVACNLKLVNYPLDSQQCNVKIMSYAHPRDQMNVTWFSRNPIIINKDIDLPEFDIVRSEAVYCSGEYEYAMTHRSYRIGEFSCLEGRIYFQRAIGYHVVQTYIPTGLIVVISWVSFWIDRSAVPARVSLTFTTLLTLSTMGAGLRYSLPPVSYAKAIDYWFGVCMLFIFGALLEFALINSLMRRSNKSTPGSIKRNENTRLKHFGGIQDFLIDPSPSDKVKKATKVIDYSAKALSVDQWCRILFPLMFLIFNLAYWGYYYYLV